MGPPELQSVWDPVFPRLPQWLCPGRQERAGTRWLTRPLLLPSPGRHLQSPCCVPPAVVSPQRRGVAGQLSPCPMAITIGQQKQM